MTSNTHAEHSSWGNEGDGWHLVKRQDMSIIHENKSAGREETRHLHHLSRQFFFVLSGELKMDVADKTHRLTAHRRIEIAPQHRTPGAKPVSRRHSVFSLLTAGTRGDRQLIPACVLFGGRGSCPPTAARSPVTTSFSA
ncbi:cupin domain-containing protein [Pantoea sp. 1.19]|uniref:cupin domain-containing protein n=1 Tax=Pantoea sp. 1.19 TaxID=1925589 RepID=UPI00352AB154